MNFQEPNRQWTEKKNQKILEKQNLWPTKRRKLESSKPKCFNCQVTANWKICIKKHKCDLYKTCKQQSGTST